LVGGVRVETSLGRGNVEVPEEHRGSRRDNIVVLRVLGYKNCADATDVTSHDTFVPGVAEVDETVV